MAPIFVQLVIDIIENEWKWLIQLVGIRLALEKDLPVSKNVNCRSEAIMKQENVGRLAIC